MRAESLKSSVQNGSFDLFSLVPNLLFTMFVEYQPCQVHTFADVPVCTHIPVNSEAWFRRRPHFLDAALAMTASPSLAYLCTTKCQPTQRPLSVRSPMKQVTVDVHPACASLSHDQSVQGSVSWSHERLDKERYSFSCLVIIIGRVMVWQECFVTILQTSSTSNESSLYQCCSLTSCHKCVWVVPVERVGNDVVRIVPCPFLPTGHTKTEMSHNLPIPRTESRSRASQECCSTTKSSSVLVTARASPSRGAHFHESSVRKVPKSSRSFFPEKMSSPTSAAETVRW